jgi:hypothetical protein
VDINLRLPGTVISAFSVKIFKTLSGAELGTYKIFVIGAACFFTRLLSLLLLCLSHRSGQWFPKMYLWRNLGSRGVRDVRALELSFSLIRYLCWFDLYTLSPKTTSIHLSKGE